MKTKNFSVVLACGLGSAALVTHAEKVQFEQLSPAIQQAIRAEAGSSQIEDIDREVRNGKTIYEAAFKKNGLSTEIVVDEQGRRLNADGGLKIAAGKVGFNELPEVIQNSIKVRAGQSAIEDIDREVRNGEVFYAVTIKENGLHRDLRIDGAGRILGDVAAPLSAPARLGNEVLLVSTTPVPFSDVPWQVQHSIQQKAGIGFNQPVQMGIWNAQKVYQVTLPQNGSNKLWQFTDKGRDVATLSTPATVGGTASAVGSPAPAATGSASSGAVAATSASVVPLNNSTAVNFSDLPWRAQTAFQKQLGQNWNGQVQKGQWNGQTVYQTLARVRGQQPMTIQFTENGQIPAAAAAHAAPVIAAGGNAPQGIGSVTKRTSPAPRSTPYALSSGTKLTLEQAPIAIREAIKAETGGAPVEDLERGLAEGMVVYEAAFKSGGKTVELQMAADGNVLHDPRSPNRTLKPAALASAAQLSGGQKIEIAQAPLAVKTTLSEKLGNNRLEEIERGTFQGKTIYEAAFKDNGKHVEIQIGEDGAVLFDPRDKAVGAAAVATTGTAASKYANIKSAVTLGSGSKLTLEQTPEAVRRALQTHVAGAQVEDLERGTWNGQTVYEAAFKSNGKHVELQLDDNGEIIFDPRNNAAK